ncbi:MAG: ATP-dependent acyl-CoA ligase [Gammaproteobacteria bacterium]|nr:ATP-dependent acyl-CoA ligase [Gammaproteobacteria bacterium]
MHRVDLSDTSNRILPKLLRLQAAAIPNAPFLIDEHRQITFAETDKLSGSLATGLRELGVAAGDRVAILLQNCPEAALVALAANKLQAVWVPISTDYKGEWLADTIIRSRAKVLVTDAALGERIASISERLGEEKLVVVGDSTLPGATRFESLFDHAPFEPDLEAFDYGDTCAVVWTSGTTGKSKGVMVSYNGWLRPIHRGVSVIYDSQPGDVILNVLPLYHAAAWNTSVFRGLAEGLPVVIEPGFSVTTFWDRIRHFGATQTFTLGAMHMFLWNAPPRPDDRDNPLRVMQAVPMPADIKAPFEERFGVKILGTGYGQSECMVITTEAGRDGEVPPNSMGFPLDDTDVRLFDDDDREVPQGDVGEVRIRPLEAYVVCNGYLDDAEAPANAWRGEWFCTGDLARKDENGAFFFADRKKDAIRFAGRNISTMEVESVVRRHPDIVDVAAFGVPAAEIAGEEELKTDVILAENASLSHEALARFVNDNAPHYFVPRYINFVNALPYTPTNKVQKFKLREKGLDNETWDRKTSTFIVQR